MTILLIFCVLAAAGWLLVSVAGRGTSDDPGNSVNAYSRAMAALDPAGAQPRRPTGAAQRPRPQRPRPRPAAASSARRRAPAPAPRRAVRR